MAELTGIRESLEFIGSPLNVTPDETLTIQCEFSALTGDSAVLKGCTVKVYEIPYETDVSATIVDATNYWDTKVMAHLSGFAAGKTYRLEVLAKVYDAVLDPYEEYENYATIYVSEQ